MLKFGASHNTGRVSAGTTPKKAGGPDAPRPERFQRGLVHRGENVRAALLGTLLFPQGESATETRIYDVRVDRSERVREASG